MRAAVLHDYRQPLRVEDVPQPAPGPDEILVQVEVCGVCHSDVHVADGDWASVRGRLKLPRILGHEVVGRVVERGADVSSLALRERVGVPWVHWSCGACDTCREGFEHLCPQRKVTGLSAPGGYAEFLPAKASHAAKIPDGLQPSEAAPLLCAGVTAYRGLKKLSLGPGHRVAVFGVGGLGHLAVQVAHSFGAQVTAVDLADAKLELARRLGAARALNAADADAAKKLRAHGGVHVAAVTAPSTTAYRQALASLRTGGTLLVLGIPAEEVRFSAEAMTSGEYRVVASSVGTRADLRQTLALAAASTLRCTVETCRLEEINQAFERLRRGRVSGRLVVTF